MTDKTATTDIAFTDDVKAMQERLGTRQQMAVMAANRGFRTQITDDVAAFLAQVDSFFLATVNSDGHPYIQHRGGAPGFLNIVDAHTLRFEDYPGNRQYLTFGNLTGNDRVHLFMVDYETKTRIKIWGRAKLVEEGTTRFIEIAVEAWDPNCPQHIPDLYSENTVRLTTTKLMARIAELEARLGDT